MLPVTHALPRRGRKRRPRVERARRQDPNPRGQLRPVSGRLPAPVDAAAGGSGPARPGALPPSRPGPRRRPSVPELARLRRHPRGLWARSPGPAGPATCAARTLGTAGGGPGRQVPASRPQPTAARALAPPRAPSPRPLPARAALPPGLPRPAGLPLLLELDARPAAPPPARSPARHGPRSGVAGPFLSRRARGAAKGGLREFSCPQIPRGHPSGASLPGRLHPRPSWKWEAPGRGKGHERAATRRGEPSSGAHRWAPLPPSRCAGEEEHGPHLAAGERPGG